MGHTDSTVIALVVMLATGLVFGALARRVGLPMVVGELCGGVLLGPTVMARYWPQAYEWLFPSTGPAASGRKAFIQLGIICFLFATGLEMNVPALKQMGRKVMWTSVLGMVVPFVGGFVMVLAAPFYWEPHVLIGQWGGALLLGTALAISALPVIARVLMDLGLAREEFGALVLAAATLDDLVGWSLFAAILATFAPGAHVRAPWLTMVLIFAFAALLLTLGRAMATRWRDWVRERVNWPGGWVGATAVLWLTAAVVAEWVGVHAVVGAFLVGLTLAKGGATRDGPAEAVHQFAMGVFAPIYFVSVGFRADFAANLDLWLVLAVFAVACIGKIGGVTFGARLAGMGWNTAIATGFGMNARGAMEMILAAVALENGLIDEPLFVALVIMALLTSVISGPVMGRLLKRGVGAGQRSDGLQVAANR